MNTEFRKHIRTSLANPTLQAALDHNAERRFKGRITALESLPHWQERRQRAHTIRAEVIEHLDEYVEQFVANATKNGMIVHRAKDADEAIKIFLEIVGTEFGMQEQAPASTTASRLTPEVLVAKSKSMVSEEINLNHVLEAKGLKVVETDLGEYIVQLRGEKPAHIITPAVHLRREQVGQLFHEKLGIPYTEDIPTLVNTARKVLREVFLTADVGFSGVNFGIAEEGAICVVSNEGNARMVTTIPKVHIALMGMERLVPTLDDLSIMLSLLARSATTQKLSVYTQIVHTPLEGQQRHIILLDNGRTRLRNSPLKESLYCIRCGACLNACPVFREIGGHAYVGVSGTATPYSGPIGSVISAGFFGSDFVPLAQASSLCGACKEACPVDIDLPKLLTRVRAGQAPVSSSQLPVNSEGSGLSSISKIFLRMYSRLATHPKLFALAQKFATLGTFLAAPFSNYVHLPAVTGWGYSKDFPRFAGKTFRERFLESNSLLLEDTRAQPHNDNNLTTEKMREQAPALQMVEQFISELTKVNGNVIQVSKADITNKVIELIQAHGVDYIHLEPNILDEEKISPAGISISHVPDPRIRIGVTKAICGLADTGSILEADGEGSPLHASLLPNIHIAILSTSDLYANMDEAIHLIKNTTAAVFITGPSRTADIESSLTLGVHGPEEVHVLLVDD